MVSSMRFRAISPIISAIILLAASIAAGIIVYQYFIQTVNVMSERPVVYFTAQYIPEISKVYVTVNNGWTKSITILSVDYTCSDGSTKTYTLQKQLQVKPGETTTFTVPVASTCKPVVILVHYKSSSGRTYGSEPVNVQ
jgi:hypothetical protein